MKSKTSLYFILLFIIGIALFYPTFNFFDALSQGDHGRDLYAFEQVMKGQLPYRDFWWVYGPLMPYYYSLFFRLFGSNIQSILVGFYLLKFLSGIFLFLTAVLIMPPLFAFITAVWFWTFFLGFFFTFNHAGGIFLLILLLHALMHYIEKPNPRLFLWGVVIIFFLSLIKINIGLFSLMAFLLSVGVVHYNKTSGNLLPKNFKKRYFVYVILLLVLIAGIYGSLLHGLSSYIIRQCFPYLKNDHPFHISTTKAFYYLGRHIWLLINENQTDLIFAIILGLSCLWLLVNFLQTKNKNKYPTAWKRFSIIAFCLAIFSILNLHEFMGSGIYYRLHWIYPSLILLGFFIIATAAKEQSKVIITLIILLFSILIVEETIFSYAYLRSVKKPSHWLNLKKGEIFVGNSPDWIQTVEGATRYLKTTLSPKELFFALPYDPLYYFLTGKDSPTRQLIFFKHINITDEQQRKIIKELENKKVNYLLISNRFKTTEIGIGYFGVTHCQILGSYIMKNFRLEKIFGKWDTSGDARWIKHHAVGILKRKKPISLEGVKESP